MKRDKEDIVKKLVVTSLTQSRESTMQTRTSVAFLSSSIAVDSLVHCLIRENVPNQMVSAVCSTPLLTPNQLLQIMAAAAAAAAPTPPPPLLLPLLLLLLLLKICLPMSKDLLHIGLKCCPQRQQLVSFQRWSEESTTLYNQGHHTVVHEVRDEEIHQALAVIVIRHKVHRHKVVERVDHHHHHMP